MIRTGAAWHIWRLLKGVICVHKPPNVSIYKLQDLLIERVCQELNELNVRPPKDCVSIEENETDPKKFSVIVRPSYADHELVVGPRYQDIDLQTSIFPDLLGNMSGLCGLKGGRKTVIDLHETKPVRTYLIEGIFGQATSNLFIDGNVRIKAKYDHLKKDVMDKVLSVFQAAHQRKLLEFSGVKMNSQAAYELASKGLIKPDNNEFPCIYGIKCVAFEPPNFTLELQCVNEDESYLLNLVYDIARRMRTFATTTKIRCIRYGCFTERHSLLLRECNLQNILDNMKLCKSLLEMNTDLVEAKSAHLVETVIPDAFPENVKQLGKGPELLGSVESPIK